MDKVITTAMLIVISMVMALMLFNIAYPAIIEGGDAIVSMAGRVEDRMRSQIAIHPVNAEGSRSTAVKPVIPSQASLWSVLGER